MSFQESLPFEPTQPGDVGASFTTAHSALERSADDIEVEPLDATFRDNHEAPLHSWFPYLEGYSPRFVRRVRDAYLRDATSIFEPFAGSGTTPVVLGQDGVSCGYAEANPVMALVAGTKLQVMRQDTNRPGVASSLDAFAREIETSLEQYAPADDLACSYPSAFGTSTYFRPDGMDAVLRLRSMNDQVEEMHGTLLRNCLSVAIMSCLLPCSLLKRSGDVRYKTKKELAAGVPSLLDEVPSTLRRMARDLRVIEPMRADARFLGSDAKTLRSLRAPFDGVITSPPYLNGTNYIRNARLELWYLRLVRSKADLRQLRDVVVTSGINDVNRNTSFAPVCRGVEQVVRDLAEQAYDQRIAKMVGGYFVDMQAVFRKIKEVVRPGGVVCVDIGDSVYANVHVRTDLLLAEMAGEMGYTLGDHVYLRKRRSMRGAELRQTLLVFRTPSTPKKTAATPGQSGKDENVTDSSSEVQHVEHRWESFKATLPHQAKPYSKRNWGSPLHSLCSYQGKLKPSLAHHLVSVFSSPGDVVVDPFSGAGTLPLEASLMGRIGVGLDISKLGYVLTRAKVERPSEDGLTALLERLGKYFETVEPSSADHESASAVSFNSTIPDYFHPDTLREVLLARRFFAEHWDESVEWAFAFASCLHILHGNRPYALSRRSHPITPYKPTGPTEYRALLPRLQQKIERSMKDAYSSDFTPGRAMMGDCTAPWGLETPADVVITSPPFYDSTRFYMTNWMRYWFTGWEKPDFSESTEDFVETKQRRSLDVYRLFFDQAVASMKPEGHLVLHLGFSKKCDMAAELLERIPGALTHVDTYYEGVEHCESHGVRDKGTVTGHSYLVLRKV